jgi:LAO/AO transport system kinase
MEEFIKKLRNGDIRTAARLMRQIDDKISGYRDKLKALYPYTGNAYIIGITGVPGAGKSTLTDKLITEFLNRGEKVGVIAIDPSSPFTGGAILGDRIRMQTHCENPDVFIRSLATRGHLGGLSSSTSEIIDVMDAMGKTIIIVETVGVGQDEIEIVDTAHTTIVVVIPGMGDDIQAIKAGILEIADLFILNKADREGASKTKREIQAMLDLSRNLYKEKKVPEIVETVALFNKGVKEAVDKIYEHRDYLNESGRYEEHNKRKREQIFLKLLHEDLQNIIIDELYNKNHEDIVEKIKEKQLNPYEVVDEIVKEFKFDLGRCSNLNFKN